jgi:ribosome-binding protein aMBF1 (putative translation factor)
VGKGPKSKPSQSDIRVVEQWLKLADEAKAWDWLIGRRIQVLRELRREQSRGVSDGPKRGPESTWLFSKLNFSQAALAARLGYSQSWLAKIEQGNRSVTVHEAHLIAQGLEVEPEAILGSPSPDERQEMDAVIQDVQRARKRKGITPEQLAAERADAQNRRRRASPRSAREQERMRAIRAALRKKDDQAK